MTFRKQSLIALFAVLGVAVEQAAAQPIAPPRRPTFSSYSSLLYPGGGYYGYGAGGYGGYGSHGGWGGPGPGANALMQQQNLQLQQQLSSFNQNITNLQSFLATGVNPNFPTTGHAAVFNNLGHWYGNVGGGSVGGGPGSGTAGIGYPLGGAMGTGTGNAAAVAGGANAPRTAGTGIPIGGPRR